MLNLKSLFEEFGKVQDGSLALTMNGQVAVKRQKTGDFVRYNQETGVIDNMMQFALDAGNMMFILPVAEVKAGDIIRSKKSYYQVTGYTDSKIKTINLNTGTTSTIVKENNMLGLNFYYKVVSLFDGANMTTTGMNPMLLVALSEGKDDSALLPLMMMQAAGQNAAGAAGMNPMMMMLMLGDKEGGKGINMKDMLMMQMMGGQAGAAGMNPMMMMLMMGDKEGGKGLDMKDMLMMQALGGGNGANMLQNMFGQAPVQAPDAAAPSVPNPNPATTGDQDHE